MENKKITQSPKETNPLKDVPKDNIMEFAEEELLQLDRAFNSGDLNAFGNKESTILKQIDNISQLQVSAFLSSMTLELKHANVDEPQSTENEFNEQEFASFAKKFSAKEKAIAKLVTDLHSISKSIDNINQEIANLKEE
jgi:hypothetical protein